MKKLLCLILVLATLVPLCSYSAYALADPGSPGQLSLGLLPDEAQSDPSSDGVQAAPSFSAELFSDVKEDNWFYDNVKTAYELGLMQGRGGGKFAPLGTINLAEVITIAARLRSAYFDDDSDFSGGDPWYAPAVDYAIAQGIIKEGDFSNYTAAATRAQVAYILSGALPSGALEEMNTVEDNSLPDVRMGDPYAANIYFLYRTGILSGNDKNGTFSPSSTITRAAAAAVASRIASVPLRVKCTFYAPVYPDLGLRTRADDSFFADAAILGNSLIDGLRLYSNIKTADYYCGTSMSVNSAMYTKNVLLKNGTYGTQLDAMAQKQYGKVYIELGINEIGGSVESYIKLYGAMIDMIKAAQPNADIYIMAITPVSKAKSQSSTVFTRDRVKIFNEALYQLAAERECYYLDDFTPLADSEGYLPYSDNWDGVHFVPAKYLAWEEVIRTHYA